MRSPKVNQWIGQANIAHALQKFSKITTGVMNLVHGVDAIALNLAVVNLGIAVNMRRQRKAPI